MLITFSGLDGAGKSTLIKHLKAALESTHRKSRILTMYDDLTLYALVRKIRDKVLRRPKGNTGSSVGILPAGHHQGSGLSDPQNDPKIDVSDKSGTMEKCVYRIIRSQPVRKFFLFFDLLILLVYRLREEFLQKNVLITDRYFYDSLADVADMNGGRWLFIRMFLKLAPTPDAPIFVDVQAEKAFERKQEYPIGYMRWRRETYHKIFGWVRKPVILLNDDLSSTMRALENQVFERMA